MKDYAGLSEATGKGVIDELIELGVIKSASSDTKIQYEGLRHRPMYEILNAENDLELPNALVEGMDDGRVTSPLKRIKVASVLRRASGLDELSKNSLRLDCVMLLLTLYEFNSMASFGGVSPRSILRKWETKSQRKTADGLYEWMSEPDEESTVATYLDFMVSSLPHLASIAPKKTDKINDLFRDRFWNAWDNIRQMSLIYEAVTMFDANPVTDQNSRIVCTLRVNDYHADSKEDGDPSLIKTMKNVGDRALHFYTNPEAPYDASGQSRQDDESLRLSWPDKSGHIVGIWRPRFRVINSDAGTWFEAELEAIEQASNRIKSFMGT